MLISIIAPASISIEKVQKVVKKLTEAKHDVWYWDRKTPYDNFYIKHCDAVVIFNEDNYFNYSLDNLPISCISEVKKAKKRNALIFTAYTTCNGKTNVYSADITENSLRSVSGSADKIITNSESYIVSCPKKEKISSFDKRLLLTI